MHLNKFIAHAGICSRRKAVELIKDGYVKVNGKTVTNPAYLVVESDQVKVKGKLISREEKIYILLNKPTGYVTTVSDEKNRKTVLDLLGKEITERVYPVGRLDINTTGLVLLTNDGELAQKLSHPKYEVKKIYHVTLNKAFNEKDRAQIQAGVTLRDGKVAVDAISLPFGPKKNQVKITIHSGKYRIIRRLFEHLGYFVKKLDRIAYAGIEKGILPIGAWRYLSKTDIKKLIKK